LVVTQLRKNPEKYLDQIKEDYDSSNYIILSVDAYCDIMEKDRINGTNVTLQAAADALGTIISVASDGGNWHRSVGYFIDTPKIPPLIITRHSMFKHYNSTVVEERNLKEEEREKIKASGGVAAPPPPKSNLPRPGHSTAIAELDEKGTLTTIALPVKVTEMVASASIHNQFAMSTALKNLYDHGVGGPAMRWAASHVLSKKLDDDQKEFLFKSVQEYVAQGKLQEAADWVQEMKDALE
jgi:hypothetical protein